jgi:hypothetical protein
MQVLDSLIDGPLRLRNRREGDELIGMIVRYLRTGEQPEPRTDAQEAVLFAVQPVMETSRKRIVAGGSGGKAASNDASKPESKRASKTGSKPSSKSGSKTQSKAASNDASKPESKRASEEEEEEELGKGIKERGKAARFRAPSPAEVAEYAQQFASDKGLDLTALDFDPERFVDFYAQKAGWSGDRT